MAQADAPGGRPQGARQHPIDGLPASAVVPGDNVRHGIRSRPGVAHVWRLGVLLLGMSLIVLGLVLTVLPGPLTIPPVLLGLWVLSTEFAWAHRLFTAFKERARATWALAAHRPVMSMVVTLAGIATAAVAFWALGHFHLVEHVRASLGL
jgi:Putative transmembrane protein (PGPGW)